MLRLTIVALAGALLAPAFAAAAPGGVWPAGARLSAGDVTSTTATLAWTPSPDAGVVAYRIHQGRELLATVPAGTTTLEVADLQPGLPYAFRVDASKGPGRTWRGPETTLVTAEAPLPRATAPRALPSCFANLGWETGDLTGWTTGAIVDSVGVVAADGFETPFEGSRMAVLGTPVVSDEIEQPEGMNSIYQDCIVDSLTFPFVYSIWTYDYTGYDAFDFTLTVLDPATGAVLASYDQGAWGREGDTSLKTSGWRYVLLDLTGDVALGSTVRLVFEAGGTFDNLYAFWVYLDSAADGPPAGSVPVVGGRSETGVVLTDPQSGEVTVAMPTGARSDVTLYFALDCPDGAMPDAATLLLDAAPFTMTLVPGFASLYSVTIPEASLLEGALSTEVLCASLKLVTTVGKIELYDPSGYITDAVTGAPVVGATVTLHKATGLTIETAADASDTTCPTPATKPAGAWSMPAPTDPSSFVVANPYGGEISPEVNPTLTNAAGYYGWDVATGCWFVTVTAPGYLPLTSPVVGVPPAVTDLDLELTPRSIGAIELKFTAKQPVGEYTVTFLQSDAVVGTCVAVPAALDLECDANDGRVFALGYPYVGLGAGTYRVNVTAPGALKLTKPGVVVGEGKTVPFPVKLGLNAAGPWGFVEVAPKAGHASGFTALVRNATTGEVIGTCGVDTTVPAASCDGEVWSPAYPFLGVPKGVWNFTFLEDSGGSKPAWANKTKVQPGKVTKLGVAFQVPGFSLLALDAKSREAGPFTLWMNASSTGAAAAVCDVYPGSSFIACTGSATPAPVYPFVYVPHGMYDVDARAMFLDVDAFGKDKLKLDKGKVTKLPVAFKAKASTPGLVQLDVKKGAAFGDFLLRFQNALGGTVATCDVMWDDRMIDCTGAGFWSPAFPYVATATGPWTLRFEEASGLSDALVKPGVKIPLAKVTKVPVAFVPAGGLLNLDAKLHGATHVNVTIRNGATSALVGECEADLILDSVECTGTGVGFARGTAFHVPATTGTETYTIHVGAGPLFEPFVKTKVKIADGKTVKLPVKLDVRKL